MKLLVLPLLLALLTTMSYSAPPPPNFLPLRPPSPLLTETTNQRPIPITRISRDTLEEEPKKDLEGSESAYAYYGYGWPYYGYGYHYPYVIIG